MIINFMFYFCLDRPLSSLTVASECSSTISSEEEEHKNIEIKHAMEVNVDRSPSSPPGGRKVR